MFRWDRHDWVRRVSATATHEMGAADMWGRAITHEHVTCHAEYVCASCGTVKAGEECGCDLARAEQCAVRLASI
jgi:hypothetical protein